MEIPILGVKLMEALLTCVKITSFPLFVTSTAGCPLFSTQLYKMSWRLTSEGRTLEGT